MNFYGHLIVKKLKDYALNFGQGSYRTTQTETKKLSNDSIPKWTIMPSAMMRDVVNCIVLSIWGVVPEYLPDFTSYSETGHFVFGFIPR